MAVQDSPKETNKKRNLSDRTIDSEDNPSAFIPAKKHKHKKRAENVESLVCDMALVNDDNNDGVHKKNSSKKRKHSDDVTCETVTDSTNTILAPETLHVTNTISGADENDTSTSPKHTNGGPKKLSVLEKLKNRKKNKKSKAETEKPNESLQKAFVPKMSLEEVMEKFPILNDQELVKRYQAVTLTNNQKGRLRQQYVSLFKSTAVERVPDAINMKLEEIVKRTDLEESQYRKIRILHNMLRTSAMKLVKSDEQTEKPKKKRKKKKNNKKQMDTEHKDPKDPQKTDEVSNKTKPDSVETKPDSDETKPDSDEAKSDLDESKSDLDETKSDSDESKPGLDVSKQNLDDEATEKVKVKGPKRYVVFVGNLPYDVDKDSIMRHFASVVSKIKDVRIPKKTDGKKGGIAYIELADEASYQMALSKNHSMLDNRRINVLYTTTGKSKIDKKEAKGKRAKLLALQKSGQLLGSAPLSGKRSARRKKQKEAKLREEALAENKHL